MIQSSLDLLWSEGLALIAVIFLPLVFISLMCGFLFELFSKLVFQQVFPTWVKFGQILGAMGYLWLANAWYLGLILDWFKDK
jgi:hypothetical protein